MHACRAATRACIADRTPAYSEKNDMTEEAQHLITAIQQMEGSLVDERRERRRNECVVFVYPCNINKSPSTSQAVGWRNAAELQLLFLSFPFLPSYVPSVWQSTVDTATTIWKAVGWLVEIQTERYHGARTTGKSRLNTQCSGRPPAALICT